jgi:hypothetical protein
MRGTSARVVGFGAATGVGALALVPMAVTFAPSLPFFMQKVGVPRWYATAAPKLPSGKVLLSYPVPFSGIQVAMAWQAVDAMSYSQAGGGGPQGVASRAGSARPGFETLSALGFGVGEPQPTGTRRELAGVRHALSVWRVNTVVIAPQPNVSFLVEGHDPTYAAAFMTAALGRLPRINAGAWVWDDVNRSFALDPVRVHPGALEACVVTDEKAVPSTRATLRVARCVLASSHATSGTETSRTETSGTAAAS